MNVALPALIVFVVLLPGFIFRVRFKRVERTSLDFSPFHDASRFYPVDGDSFVLRYSEMITLNVEYVHLG